MKSTIQIIFTICAAVGTAMFVAFTIYVGAKGIGIKEERAIWTQKCLENGYGSYDKMTGKFIFHDFEYLENSVKKYFPNIYDRLDILDETKTLEEVPTI